MLDAVGLSVQVSSCTVEVAGELDLATSPILAAALEEASTRGRTVSLDLRAVTFMDAAGVRTLAAHTAAVGDGCRLEVWASPIVDRLFRLVGSVNGIGVSPDS